MNKLRSLMRSLVVIGIDDELYGRVKAKIILEESSINKMYRCSAGSNTIGVGHNLDSNPISDEAIDVIFRDDLSDVIRQLDEHFAWWRDTPAVVQIVLMDFIFNVGIGTAKKFKNTMRLIEQKEYVRASYALLNSHYAKQVPNRALRNSILLRSAK